MAIHHADRASDNPRLQCACCGKWKRLHGQLGGKIVYRFYGGCRYTSGDHLCAKTADTNDVCDNCCQTECKRIAEQEANAERAKETAQA